MAWLRIKGRQYQSIEPPFKANSEGDMIYVHRDALRVKSWAKKKGYLCRVRKYGHKGDPFWVVYVAFPERKRSARKV